MLWVLFALGGAFFSALQNLVTKHVLKKQNEYTVAAGSFLFTAVILLGLSWWRGIPEIGGRFVYASLGTIIVNIIASILLLKGLKNLDLSLAMPILALTPLFMIFTSYILLGEVPSRYGIVGIAVGVIGLYILAYKKDQKGWFAPFKELIKNKYMLYVLAVAILYSVSASFDKLVVLNSDAYFGSGMVFLGGGIALLTIAKVKGHSMKYVWKSWYIFAGIAIIAALTAVLINYAYTLQLASYVSTVKRTSALFSVIFGYVILKETEPIKRLIGAVFIVAGIALLLL